MGLERRTVIKLLAGVAVGGSGFGGMVRSRASATTLALRSVTAADAPFVRAMINMCVGDDGAFHGKCGDWSAEWATEFVTRAPRSVVLTLGNLPVAFQEVPRYAPHRPRLVRMPPTSNGCGMRAVRRTGSGSI